MEVVIKCNTEDERKMVAQYLVNELGYTVDDIGCKTIESMFNRYDFEECPYLSVDVDDKSFYSVELDADCITITEFFNQEYRKFGLNEGNFAIIGEGGVNVGGVFVTNDQWEEINEKLGNN